MSERGWWCPNCKQIVRVKAQNGCGWLLVATAWLGILAVAVWLAAWWLMNVIGLLSLPGAAVAAIVAGIVVKLVQDKLSSSAHSSCPICKTEDLQPAQVVR